MFTLAVDKDLELALVQPSFAKDYYRIVNEQRQYLAQWLAWVEQANSIDFFTAFIQRCLHEYADTQSLTCAIIYHGEIVGNVSLNRISTELKKVEVGYWLRQDHQGKGIATRSVTALVDHAFEHLDMELAEIRVAVGNRPSRSLCERLGFKLSGVIANSEKLNGQIIDHEIYTLRRDTQKLESFHS